MQVPIEAYKRLKWQIILFCICAIIYVLGSFGIMSLYWVNPIRSTQTFLASCFFLIGGFLWSAWFLMSRSLELQKEPEKSQTQRRLKIVSVLGWGVLVVFVLLLALNWIMGEPFDMK